MAYIRRWAEAEYSLAETIFKVVIFSGVRQCGKTTLMRVMADLLVPSTGRVLLDNFSGGGGTFRYRYFTRRNNP